jgi:phage shock protein PspC (stress-responsive transcriptional regulator)
MPTLMRLLTIVAVLFGLGWGALYWVATSVEPVERDMSFRVPPERFLAK